MFAYQLTYLPRAASFVLLQFHVEIRFYIVTSARVLYTSVATLILVDSRYLPMANGQWPAACRHSNAKSPL